MRSALLFLHVVSIANKITIMIGHAAAWPSVRCLNNKIDGLRKLSVFMCFALASIFNHARPINHAFNWTSQKSASHAHLHFFLAAVGAHGKLQQTYPN